MQHTFEALKKATHHEPPIFDYPQHNNTFVFTMDAPDSGIGVALSMIRGTVIEYTIGTLTKVEHNYLGIWQWSLGFPEALTSSHRCYLIGKTNHKSFELLQSKKYNHAHFRSWRGGPLNHVDLNIQ